MKSKTLRTLSMVGLCLAAGLAHSQAKLKTFSTSADANGFTVRISGENLPKPVTSRVMGNKSLLLTFDAYLMGKAQKNKIGKGGLESVQSSWFSAKPPRTRIHLRLDPKIDPTIVADGKDWLVTWTTSASKDNVVTRALGTVSAPFPTSVPPITNSTRQAVPAWANKAVATEPVVSLEFVNTEVVQILKALAMQAGVNIVTSPDVKGTLTVSLNGVRVNEALDLVTTLTGVRYAKVGRTFVVTAGSKFADAMRQIGGTIDEASETRVVSIFSGEGNQIKAAVLRSTVLDTAQGRIELVLPSEELKVEKKEVVKPENQDDSKKADEGSQTSIETKSGTAKDPYIVVIGPPSHMPAIERQIQTIDKQLCLALGVEVPMNSSMTRTIYHPKGTTAQALLVALAGSSVDKTNPNKAKIGTVELLATPAGSVSGQALVLYGRDNEVAAILANLENIDQSVGGGVSSFMIYEIKFADPRALRDELKGRIPGMNITIPPGAAANPELFVDKTAPASNTSGAGTGGSSPAAGGTGASGANGALTNAFKGLESGAHPMRLLLSGTADQLRAAAELLAAIDYAPRQVAIELRVLELSNDDSEKIGLKWNLSTGGSISNVGVDHGFAGGIVSGTITLPGAPMGSNFQLALDKITGNGKTIARPNLLAVDGRHTETFIGNEIRYVQSIQSTQNGITVTTAQVNVGIGFAVFPRIGANNELTLDLRTEVSSLQAFTDIPGGGKLPQTGHRIAQTTVQMRSGETIALGGLIQESDTVNEVGIPILKDIPIIGRLFSRKDKSKTRSEVVLLITAKVLDASNRSGAADPREKKDGNTNSSSKQGNDAIIKN